MLALTRCDSEGADALCGWPLGAAALPAVLPLLGRSLVHSAEASLLGCLPDITQS